MVHISAPAAEPQRFELVYFPAVKGRVEIIRLLAELGDLSLSDRVITDWPAPKKEMPFGQLPVLIFKDSDGEEVHLAQSGAIKRFLAAKAGVLPADDPVAVAVIDSLGEAFRDMFEHLVLWKYRTPPGEPQDAYRARITGEIAPEFVATITRHLEAAAPAAAAGKGGTGYLLRAKKGRPQALTLAELDLYTTIEATNEFLPRTFTRGNAPALFKVVDIVRAHPKLQTYFSRASYASAE